MKVLITGANGQLGYALQKTAPTYLAENDVALQLIALTRAEFDLAQPETLVALLNQYQPDAIINAAAYTAVDKAEADQVQASITNASAVAVIACWCEAHNTPLIQVSTDFVFDGKKSSPYLPDDETNPLGVYGQTKCAGELAALDNCSSGYVVRTGWVYCEQGNNFVKTMLRLGAEREVLGVVADQVGTPTYAVNLAQINAALLNSSSAEAAIDLFFSATKPAAEDCADDENLVLESGGPLQAAVAEGIPVITLNSGSNDYQAIGALTHVG